MKLMHFPLALLVISCVTIARVTSESMELFVTNNGQIDLVVNGVFVPANPMDKDLYRIHAIQNKLVVSMAHQEPRIEKTIILKNSDAGSVIRIGGHNNAIYAIRPDGAPIVLLRHTHGPKKL